MFVERLTTWYSKHGHLPSKVIYYRDGVGESQYTAVLHHEVSKIEAAFEAVREAKRQHLDEQDHMPTDKLLITAIVVTKRHHTRFYPHTHQKHRNCDAGTCVDSIVTHPVYFDFYLQSHLPSRGTARPTYYFVLRNDIAFSASQLQTLTNCLCYTYVRCASPVSYAPPVYYADKLCERMRLYIKRTQVEELVLPAERPQMKPAKVNGESREDRKGKMDTYNEEMKDSEAAVKRAWKSVELGQNDGEVRSHDPWHAKLNDTMFWM